MAAPGLIRLRLVFDYPPPSAADCRRCWLLVDRSRCRVVADVESLVRERFNFSRWSVFSLFVEECYLPSTESVHVLRDNDCVSVKVDYLSPSDELSCSPHPTVDRRQKKRLRDGGEDEERVEPVERKRKKRKAGSEERSRAEDGEKKKKKKKAKTVSEGSVPLGSDDPQKQEIQLKKKKKKKKKKRGPEPTPPAAVSTTSRNLTVTPPKVSANGSMTKQSSTKSSSTKAPLKTKSNAAPSSSSDTDSSSTAVETSESSSKPLLNGLQKGAASTLDLPDTNSEEEIQLVIHTPVLGLGSGRGNFGRGFIPRGRGDGRGRVEGWGRGYRGHNISINGTKEAPTETSIPVKLQNGAPPTAKQDYSSMPLLAGPPQVGQKIAFKLLELTESYTPEVSEYKEGKIISFDPVTKQIELELLTALAAPTEPGKFDLVYQNADGSETVEYAVARSSRVTERWESLLEPRLVLHTPLQESLP